MANCASASYVYQGLAHADSIRLIELQPGAKGTPLACNIITVRRSENPIYEALSYAWGEPIFSHVIEEVTTQSVLRVTLNLHDALQALRYEHDTRLLWADSLSINQTDLKEKGDQVALMGPTYRDAQRVVVWLGLSKIASSRITMILDNVLQSLESYRSRKDKSYSPIDLWRTVVRLSTMKLLQQPWYSRVWVVQEFVLAHEVQIIIGNCIIPLDVFRVAVNAVHNLRRQLDEFDRESGYEVQQTRVNASLMSLLFSYREQYALSTTQHCSQDHGTAGITLGLCLVDSLQGRLCKDARDRIFGMLALAEDDFGIRPDYTLPLAALLNDFAKRSLLSGDLSVLHGSGIRPNHSSQLLSFVPSVEDWSGMTMPLHTPELHFSASPSQLARVTCTSPGQISIKGVRVDEILRTMDIDFSQPAKFGITSSSLADDFGSWYDSTQSKLESCTWSMPDRLYTFVPLGQVFGRLLRLDRESLTRTAMDYRFNSQPLPPLWSDATFLKNRVIFDTKTGFVGLGPRWMQPGDCIVIFDGGKTPFIIRKHASSAGGFEPMWRLVGDCFLLDWMDGNCFGHTVVDKMSELEAGNDDARHKKKFLLRESFALC